MEIIEKHRRMLYPMVRVRTEKAGGSGTIVYSEKVPGEEGKFETYLLSNYHVVDEAVKQEKEWSPLLQRDVKKDVTKEALEMQLDNPRAAYYLVLALCRAGDHAAAAEYMSIADRFDVLEHRALFQRLRPMVARATE